MCDLGKVYKIFKLNESAFNKKHSNISYYTTSSLQFIIPELNWNKSSLKRTKILFQWPHL